MNINEPTCYSCSKPSADVTRYPNYEAQYCDHCAEAMGIPESEME